MAHYLLQKPWTLRGFLDEPYVLIDPTGSAKYPVRVMNETLFRALLQCDGRTDMEENNVLRILQKHDLILPVPEDNEGLSPEQGYLLHRYEYKPAVLFAITGKCNLNCLHCLMAADKEGSREAEDWTREQLLHVVDQFLACGVDRVELTGGEPLVSPHFKAVVERLTKRHIAFTRLLTNGVNVNEELLDFLDAQGQKPQIVVSFDGLGTHDILRNHPHAQEAALDAMHLAVARGFPLQCTMQVNRFTVPRLIETCRFLKDMGAGLFYLIRTMEAPRWAENEWVDESLPVSEYYDICCKLAETMIKEQWNIPLQVFNGFYLYFDPAPRLSVYDTSCSEHESCNHRCGRAANSFFIDHTGRVLPCAAFEGIGKAGGLDEGETLKEKPLEELLNTSLCAKVANTTLGEIKNANEDCRDCSFFPDCGGGCRAVGYGSSLFHEGGYVQGHGRLVKKAFTACAYYRGGYRDRILALTEKAAEEAVNTHPQ